MNWTEGSLARHSRGRGAKETLLRQKQHFAKVRSGLSNSNTKISPSSISFLARICSPLSSQHSSVKHTYTSAPATKRRRTDYAAEEANVSVKGLTNRYPAPSELNHVVQQGEQTLDESRRRLLQKSDWVGIAMQKPLDLHFSVPSNTPGHPWSRHGPHYSTWRNSARHIIGSKYDQMKNRQHERQDIGESPTQSFRVRVGSREIRLGAGSDASSGKRVSSRAKKNSKKSVSSKRRQRQQRTSSSSSIQNGESIIYQPIPRRIDISRILRIQSADSQAAQSTRANVGRPSSPIPPSQIRDNEMWKNRVALEGAPNSTSSYLSRSSEAPRDITPGISEMLPANQSNEGTTTYAISSTKDSEYTSSDYFPIVQREQDMPSVERPLLEISKELGKTDADDRYCITSSTHEAISTLPHDHSPRKGSPFRRHLHEEACPPLHAPGNFLTGMDTNVPGGEISAITDYPCSSPLLLIAVGGDEQATQTFLTTKHKDSKDQSTETSTRVVNEDRALKTPSAEAENEAWRKFVFGLSEDDEAEGTSFQDAAREAARDLKPSEASIITHQDVSSAWGNNIETIDTSDIRTEHHTNTSQLATLDSASYCSEMTELPELPDLESMFSTIGSSNNYESYPTSPPPTEAVIGLSSEPNSTAVEPAQSQHHEETSFRFAPPRTFVGKLSEPGDSAIQQFVARDPPPKASRRIKTVGKSRTRNKRTGIRALPDYAGDPIEEFDNTKSRWGHKSSLFGQLETQ